jgi:hypothetical protein
VLAQGAGADVAEDPLAAGLVERVELQREVLLAGWRRGRSRRVDRRPSSWGRAWGAIGREASDETAQIGWSFSTGFATAPAARRRAFGGRGLVFGFSSVSGRFRPG